MRALAGRLLVMLSVIAVLLNVSACTSVSYVSQAAAGQLSIWWQRQPIDSLLADPAVDPQLKQRLRRVAEIRAFASRELGLPDNGSYRSYAELERPYVVWNVFAAGELTLQPETWCFPLIGCVSYRGYFSQESASQFRDQLEQQGLDTYVAGVPAYSTLGWFDDPVLSTVIHYDDTRLAGLIFHELAHQQLFIAGDTAFNESFATAVEIEGVTRWLRRDGKAEAVGAFTRRFHMHKDFVDTVLSLRRDLQTLYAQGGAKAILRDNKQQRLQDFLQQDYAAFKRRWDGATDYDDWVGRDLNNAKLVSLSSYYLWLDRFRELLAECDNDLALFYEQVEVLAQGLKAGQGPTEFEKWECSVSL